MDIRLTAVFRKVPEGYIAFVEELPGANTQGSTLDEARVNLEEATALVLEANRTLAEEQLGGAEVIRERLPVTSLSGLIWFATSRATSASYFGRVRIIPCS